MGASLDITADSKQETRLRLSPMVGKDLKDKVLASIGKKKKDGGNLMGIQVIFNISLSLLRKNCIGSG